MTVKELINLLTTMPQDALVVTEVYSYGFDTVDTASVISVKENPQKAWYLGKYIDSAVSEIMYECVDSTNSETIDVVFLFSTTKYDNK